MLGRMRRRSAVALAGVLAVCCLEALEAPTAEAYNVCSDPGHPCTHEWMSEHALQLLAPGAEAANHFLRLKAGAGHEDEYDHIYGYPDHALLGMAIPTMPHFWDADHGDHKASTYGDFEGPVDVIDTSFIVTENALEKARNFWPLALGSYSRGDEAKAYEYLGHIAHLLGDMSVPTHAHGDAHVDFFGDSDPYEEWMSNSTDDRPIDLTDAELEALRAAESDTGPGPLNGPLDGNVPSGVDPLYYLLYTTNQLADFFASRDVDGDTTVKGSEAWLPFRAEIESMDQSISSPRVQDDLDDNDINDDDGDLSRVRAVTYMYGIRAIAALYRIFERTVNQPTLAVAIRRVKDSDDDADTISDADFYGKVTIEGDRGQNRGDAADCDSHAECPSLDQEVLADPRWAYGATVPLTGTALVRIEIWDEDGASPLVPSDADDLIDIDPDDSDDDSRLDLKVDMAKCIKKEADAITGDATGACGELLQTEGDHVPTVGDSERAEVQFRIFVPSFPTTTTITAPAVQYAQDPNRFTAKVMTPGDPDKPRQDLPVVFKLTDGIHTQTLDAVTDADGVAAPKDLLTLPAGDYTLTASFAGTTLLTESSSTQSVTIARDVTSANLTVEPKIEWSHEAPMKVTLMEPNASPQAEGPLPIPGKSLTITLSGPLGSQSYPVGSTSADGTASIKPLMTLSPGSYTAKACFVQDSWFAASCSAGQAVKVTLAFSGFARSGPISFSGTDHRATGDLHSEGSATVSGVDHVLSAAAGERFEYVSTFNSSGINNTYNEVKVPASGIVPSYLRSTYCTGAPTLMGVPVTYLSTSVTFKPDQVISGIYCVTGDIKIQSRVTGKAVLLATGTITTFGPDHKLQTADPTGADVLLLAGSSNPKAISIQTIDSTFTGAIIATGGVSISSTIDSTFESGLVGSQVQVSGSNNLLKAAQ
jgi:hypothetical protein